MSAKETLSVLRLWPFNTASSPILDGSPGGMEAASSDAVQMISERSLAALVAGFFYSRQLTDSLSSWINFFSGSGNFNTANRIS